MEMHGPLDGTKLRMTTAMASSRLHVPSAQDRMLRFVLSLAKCKAFGICIEKRLTNKSFTPAKQQDVRQCHCFEIMQTRDTKAPTWRASV
jgi:hypothetical protein